MAGAEAWLWPIAAAALVGALASGLFVRARRLRTVFISYRRSETATEATEVAAALARRFGRARVFLDAQSIVPGEDFRVAITRTLRRCDAAIVVIGPTWTTMATNGTPRLQQPADIVRTEVAAALESGARVLPLLVRGASMPQLMELPTDLARLPRHQVLAWAGEPSSEPLCTAVAAAPMRHTPLFLTLCHAGALVVLTLFLLVDGLTSIQFSTAAAIALPGLGTALAAHAALRWNRRLSPVRSAWVPVSALAAPLAFLALIALLVVMKALNLGLASFEGFKVALAATELAWGSYTGLALAHMFSHSGGDDEPLAETLA